MKPSEVRETRQKIKEMEQEIAKLKKALKGGTTRIPHDLYGELMEDSRFVPFKDTFVSYISSVIRYYLFPPNDGKKNGTKTATIVSNMSERDYDIYCYAFEKVYRTLHEVVNEYESELPQPPQVKKYLTLEKAEFDWHGPTYPFESKAQKEALKDRKKDLEQYTTEIEETDPTDPVVFLTGENIDLGEILSDWEEGEEK